MFLVEISQYYEVYYFSCLQGAQGITGPQGIQGETGPIGPKGDQGKILFFYRKSQKRFYTILGEKGDKGVIGPQGPEVSFVFSNHIVSYKYFEKGKQGPIGLTGDKGDQGIIGPVGEKGECHMTKLKI